MKRSRKSKPTLAVPRVPFEEQLLLDLMPDLSGDRVLCSTVGRAQFAAGYAAVHPTATVCCLLLDCWQHAETVAATADLPVQPQLVCQPDFPETPADLVAIPVLMRGEAELTRELLQSGYERLVDGGTMIASSRNRDDTWLHEELRKLFGKVRRRPAERGVTYLGVRTGPLKRPRQFRCEFMFRDRDHLIHAVSRPGVFSHRSLDAGARALINTMEITPGMRVLDLGCGCGAVGFAAMFRAHDVSVTAIDSHARAIECTAAGAAKNQIKITTCMTDTGETGTNEKFDLVLGNPPYFSDYRIAEIFLQAGAKALLPGGRIHMVTKSPKWYEHRMSDLFTDVQTINHKMYYVVTARSWGP